MSQKIPLLTLTVTASGAVTAHRFVGFTGAQLAAAGAKAMGVATTDAIVGDDLAVDVVGTSVVEAGGAFSVGDDIVADASGRAIVNPALGGEVVLGQALEDSGGAGEFVELLLAR